MSDSVPPHRRQATRLLCPWDSPGKNTGVGCHFLLQSMKVNPLSCVWLFATPWTVVHQDPLSMGFSRKEYCSGVPCPSPHNTLWGVNKHSENSVNLDGHCKWETFNVKRLDGDLQTSMLVNISLVCHCHQRRMQLPLCLEYISLHRLMPWKLRWQQAAPVGACF